MSGITHTTETEQRIIEAAEQEFMLKGFAGARTSTIAERAGVTHAMLHYYFRTKENLFERIMADKLRLLREVFIIPGYEREVSLNELIRRIIDRHLDIASENPDLPHFIMTEIHSNPERSETILEKLKMIKTSLLDGLQTKIDAAVARGECRKIDAASLILDIISLNIFPFVAKTIVNSVFEGSMDDMKSFVERRKQENYDTIMRKIRP